MTSTSAHLSLRALSCRCCCPSLSLNIIDESPEPKLSRAATLSGLSPAEAAELHFRVEVSRATSGGVLTVVWEGHTQRH
eukprot:365247-Chlamydomonas_euryale.AAC.8